MNRIVTKFKSRCGSCNAEIPAGVTVQYDPVAKKVYHVSCEQKEEPVSSEPPESVADKLGFE